MRTRERVRALTEQGLSATVIARQLGLAKSTVVYHLRRLGHQPDDRFNRRYDWAEVQAYYDAGHSVTDCQRRFGFSRKTWADARNRGAVKARPQATPIEELLVVGLKRNRLNLKSRLIAAGLKEHRCEECGIAEWLGAPLALPLHHVNGDGHDNRLENLRILCPNCHSQTENFAGRNVSRLPVRRRFVSGQDLAAVWATEAPRTFADDLEGFEADIIDPFELVDGRG